MLVVRSDIKNVGSDRATLKVLCGHADPEGGRGALWPAC